MLRKSDESEPAHYRHEIGMNSKLRFDGALSDGADEVDLDFVRKLVIQPIFASDSLVSPSKKRRYLTGVELRRIEWWDKSKASEVVTFAIFGNPKEVIRNLVLYRKEHKFNSFWSDVDKKGIQVVTAEEERAAESEHGRKATKWFFCRLSAVHCINSGRGKSFGKKGKADKTLCHRNPHCCCGVHPYGPVHWRRTIAATNTSPSRDCRCLSHCGFLRKG